MSPRRTFGFGLPAPGSRGRSTQHASRHGVQNQSYGTSHQGSIDADVLEVSPDLDLDFSCDLLRAPVADCRRDEPCELMALAPDQLLQDLNEPRVQSAQNGWLEEPVA